MELTPAKWPVELVLIANAMGREAYLDLDGIQTILSPTIQATCRLKPEETICFPIPLHPSHNSTSRTPACPTRLIPHMPAIGASISERGPPTPHQGQRPDTPSTSEYTCPAMNPPFSTESPHELHRATHLHIYYYNSTNSPPLQGHPRFSLPTWRAPHQSHTRGHQNSSPKTGYTQMAPTLRATQG